MLKDLRMKWITKLLGWKYYIGDRVEMLITLPDNGWVLKGMKGTVKQLRLLSDIYVVQFDNFDYGCEYNGLTPNNSGWVVESREMKAINEPRVKTKWVWCL